MTRRLVLTTRDSSAGYLKQLRRGDVVGMQHRLVGNPAPADEDIGTFFAQRQSLHSIAPEQFSSWIHDSEEPTIKWFKDFPILLDKYQELEFWADPSPNAQLILIQFLDWISRQDFGLEKFKLVHAERELGGQSKSDPRNPSPALVKADSRHLQLARRAWAAYRYPTPERWVELLEDDLRSLPLLRRTVLRMLHELPAEDTGLSASEFFLLTMVSQGTTADDALRASARRMEVPFLDYWEMGKALDYLATSPMAAILGLEDGPFDTHLHDDVDRFRRYMSSRLSLSHFGAALIRGQEDLVHQRKICRWLGGTKLTNDVCWRWREREQILLAPS